MSYIFINWSYTSTTTLFQLLVGYKVSCYSNKNPLKWLGNKVGDWDAKIQLISQPSETRRWDFNRNTQTHKSMQCKRMTCPPSTLPWPNLTTTVLQGRLKYTSPQWFYHHHLAYCMSSMGCCICSQKNKEKWWHVTGVTVRRWAFYSHSTPAEVQVHVHLGILYVSRVPDT